MRLSSGDLNTLRTRPFKTKLDLFVFRPRAVLKCQVNNPAIAKGARTIAFDSVSSGTHLEVLAGMTLLIGTTEGGSEIGSLRIKSISASEIVVSENSNIPWADNLYLTVLRYWDLWPIFPKIISDPNNNENVIFYKDYDVPYVNQNWELGTLVNAGPHRPVFLESGTGSVYYSSTGTLNLLGNAVSYNWHFEGGTPTGSTSATPGYINYTTPGDYVTRLIVTDSGSGVTDTTYRYISVKNKIGEGSVVPIEKWEMSTLSGSRDEGGYSTEVTVYGDTDIDDNCLVMLKAEDFYGSTKTSLGGNYPNASDTFFVGYIEKGTIQYNAFQNSTTFVVSSITNILKHLTGFSVSVESKQNPFTWYELRDMDMRRAIYHYLRWHSTVLSVTDFSFVGTDYKIQYFDVDRTSIFDAIDNLLKSTLMGRLSADRQGRLWATVDPLAYDDPTGTFTPVMEVTKRDWMGTPRIEEPLLDSSSYIELGGIAYSGATTGTFSALLSGAPGSAPSYQGSVEKMTGLALASQTHINKLSGSLWSNRNQSHTPVSMEMANPARNLDIAPQEVVNIQASQDDIGRDFSINKLYIPSSFEWVYDAKNQTLHPRIEFVGLVNGNPGDTILIPETVEAGEFNFPSFSFPPFPTIMLPGLEIINPLSVDNLVIHIKGRGIFYTNNLQSASPSWASANLSLEGAKANFRNFEVSEGGEVFVQVSNESIWGATAPGQPWKSVFLYTQITNPQSFPFPREQEVYGFGINRQTGDVLVLAGLIVTIGSNSLVYPWYGNIDGVVPTASAYLFENNAAARYGYLTYGNDSWVYVFSRAGGAGGQVSSVRLSNNGSSLASSVLVFTGVDSDDSVVSTRSPDAPFMLAAKAPMAGTSGKRSTDDGVTFVNITGANVPYTEGGHSDRFESLITNEDGTQIVIASNSIQGISISTNGGISWSTGTFGSSGTTSVWHIGENAYAYGGGNDIYFVPDILTHTGSAIKKTGNLRNIVTGTFQVVAIRHY